MRILLSTSTFPRWEGDDTTPFILQFAQEMVRRGVEVDVLAPHAPGATLREQIEGITVERFRYALPESAQTVCYSGGALNNIAASRRTAVKLPALVLAQWRATMTRARSRRYDAISAHWLLPQAWTATRFGSRGVPVVSTVHGSDIFGLNGMVLGAFKRSALLNSDVVTANSTATSSAIQSLARGRVNPRVIPMGVRLARESVPEGISRWRACARGLPLIAFVGRLVECKGVQDLLAALSLAKAHGVELRTVVAGDGPIKNELQAQSQALGLDDHVTFVGWLQPEDVSALQAAADVVVAPSRIGSDGAREAQGLSVIEAMALGRPVVATRVGGIPDAISSGHNGLLVEPGNPVELFESIAALVKDTEFADRLGGRASQSVARFSWDRVGCEFAALFHEVASRRKAL